jgi:hypothetical protein
MDDMGAVKQKAPAKKKKGVVKKKAGKAKIDAGTATVQPGALVSKLEAVADIIEGAAPVATMLLEDVASDVTFPQALLRAKLLLDGTLKKLKALGETIEARGKEHFTANGEFEPGKIAVTFPVTVRVAPKWKDEAIKLAEEKAELLDKEWDEAVYVKGVQESYPASESMKMKLTESA